MLAIDRSAHYDIGDTLAATEGYSSYWVRELVLESPGIMYRIPIRGADQDVTRERFGTLVLPYASVRDGQLPLLADAWMGGDVFSIVYLLPRVRPLAIEGPNPFRGLDDRARLDLLAESLDLLATLHDAEIAHCHLRATSYGIDERGIVHLHDPGLAARLAAIQREADDAASHGRLKLSSNMKSLDVACWANEVVGLVTGAPLLGYEFDEWDNNELLDADARLRKAFGAKAPLAEFFSHCLRGRTFEGGGYLAAPEAARELEKIRAKAAA